MNIWQERISNISFLSLCFLSCFPLLGMKVTVIAIIAFAVMSFLSAMISWNNKIVRENYPSLIIFLIPFLLIFFRTMVTDGSDDARFYLEVSSSLFAFPATFFLYHIGRPRHSVKVPLMLFTGSTLIVVSVGLMSAGSRILSHLGPDKFWKSTSQMLNDPSLPYHIRTLFEERVGIHPTHASVFIGISIVIAVSYLIRNFYSGTTMNRVLLISMASVLVMMLAVLASRTPFIATGMAVLTFAFLHFRRKVLVLYVIAGLILLTGALALTVPSFTARFSEISFSNAGVPGENEENSFNLRSGIYKCSTEIISNHWLWGVGPGNIQNHLNECYDQISPEVYHGKNYNTHNQFLDYWIGLGVLGPLALMLVFAYFIITGYRNKNHLAVSLAILFLIAMLTENLLTRQNGVVVFCFFLGLMFRNHKLENPAG
jgi:O-antigen ligase